MSWVLGLPPPEAELRHIQEDVPLASGGRVAALLSVDDVAAALRRLVGWGVSPDRLIQQPMLRELLLAPAGLSANSERAGAYIYGKLEQAVNDYSGSMLLDGRTYDAEKLVEALRLLLGFNRSDLSAPARRWAVIDLLGLRSTPDQLRRAGSQESQLLTMLAADLLGVTGLHGITGGRRSARPVAVVQAIRWQTIPPNHQNSATVVDSTGSA